MFRRSTKITSLLVAAASVATMVPAMAADKIADKDGTIYKAVAYKDGKFYVDGDNIENANDKDGVYYLDGGKYTDVDDDIDSGDTIKIYGKKYVEIEDGDYYLDLETGKVTDDEIAKDDAEDAASELRKKIRKDDPSRYDENLRDKVADIDDFNTNTTTGEMVLVPSAKFTEPYYEVNYLKKNASDDWNYTVYTDKNGKYVDADNDLGKLNLIITDKDDDILSAIAEENADGKYEITTPSAVSFKDKLAFDEVGSKKTDENDKTRRKEYKVEILKNSSHTLGSDEKYIYRTVGLQISYCANPYNADGTEKSNKVFTVMKAAFFGSEKNPNLVKATEYSNGEYAFQVVQKISKEQGDDKDDAKLPKSTETYLVNEYKDFRLKDNFAEEKGDFDKYQFYTIADGKLTNFGYNDSDEKFGAVTFKFSSKNGSYYLDQDDTDMDVDDYNEDDWDLDKDGNLWYMNSGKIYKYNNKGDFGSAVYKVDGGFDELSVYDDNNLIAYNEDDDTYAIVGGKSSTGKYDVKDDEQQQTTTTAQAGWVQDATTGAWSYVKADGTKAIGWFQSPTSGLWYYMDANGIMKANGWIQDGASWYYLDASGAMKTGWVYTGGAWYYLKETAGNKGAMQTGWIQWKGKWYYCNASGAMLSNTTVGGYVLGADGAWIK